LEGEKDVFTLDSDRMKRTLLKLFKWLIRSSERVLKTSED